MDNMASSRTENSQDSVSLRQEDTVSLDFNFSVIQMLGNIKCILEDSMLKDIECEIDNVLTDIQDRIKLIKIADKTEGGWTTVDEYEKSDYADDSEDD